MSLAPLFCRLALSPVLLSPELPPSDFATATGSPPFALEFAFPDVLPFEVAEPLSADEPQSASTLHVGALAFDDWSMEPPLPPAPPLPPEPPVDDAELPSLELLCDVEAVLEADCAAICAATGTFVTVVVFVLFELIVGLQLPNTHVEPGPPASEAGTTTSAAMETTKPTNHLILEFKVLVSFRASRDS